MTPQTAVRATIDDLYKIDGKAELVGGVIVEMSPIGFLPGDVAFAITAAVKVYATQTGRGRGIPDPVAFTVPKLSSGRETFSPDSAYYTGPLPKNLMRFIEGVPDFAAEVRSENDHGPAAEREMALKRADYFEAGTRIVWDVDPDAQTIRAYLADAPDAPRLFTVAGVADAEPVMPGWRLPLAEIFAEG